MPSASQASPLLGLGFLFALCACSVESAGASSAVAKRSASNQAQQQASSSDAQPPSTAAACGTSDKPDCPLQRWMKSTLQAYLRKQQYKSVGPAFDELAKLDLPEYPEWRTFAEHGQAAADKRDEVAVKQACKGCHDAYRARYRKERRDRPVF